MCYSREYSSYWSEYHRALRDPTSVVLVAEDVVSAREDLDIYPALKNAAEYSPIIGAAGSKIVVGVASVNLKIGSVYTGTFQPMCELIELPVLDLRLELTEQRLHGTVEILPDTYKCEHESGLVRRTSTRLQQSHCTSQG